jgi:hypothetical protein
MHFNFSLTEQNTYKGQIQPCRASLQPLPDFIPILILCLFLQTESPIDSFLFAVMEKFCNVDSI